MKGRDLVDLLLLAAIWGSSFLFMRLGAPAFGPVALAFVRVFGAALVLLPLLAMRGELPVLRAQAGPLLVLGLTNSALPFLFFGFAVLTLPSGLTAIFNAATPLATAVIAWLWLGQPLTRWRSLGLAIGFTGVAGLALQKSLVGATSGATLDATATAAAAPGIGFDPATLLAIGACLLGTLLYGFAGNFAQRHLRGVPSMAMAAGTQLTAAAALALPAWWLWPATNPPASVWWMAAALAVLCSGVAYILFFRLLTRVGPTQASSVTFLVPVFASGWGAMLLDEPVTLAMLVGGAVILSGTALVLGLWPKPRHT